MTAGPCFLSCGVSYGCQNVITMTVQEAQAKAAALEANVNRWLSQALHLRQHGRAASKASRRDMAEELEALAYMSTLYAQHMRNKVQEAIGDTKGATGCNQGLLRIVRTPLPEHLL